MQPAERRRRHAPLVVLALGALGAGVLIGGAVEAQALPPPTAKPGTGKKVTSVVCEPTGGNRARAVVYGRMISINRPRRVGRWAWVKQMKVRARIENAGEGLTFGGWGRTVKSFRMLPTQPHRRAPLGLQSQ
jgi:hypothetical protein